MSEAEDPDFSNEETYFFYVEMMEDEDVGYAWKELALQSSLPDLEAALKRDLLGAAEAPDRINLGEIAAALMKEAENDPELREYVQYMLADRQGDESER